MKKIGLAAVTGLLSGLTVVLLLIGLNPSLIRHPGSSVILGGLLILFYGLPVCLAACLPLFLSKRGASKDSAGVPVGHTFLVLLVGIVLCALVILNYYLYAILLPPASKIFLGFLALLIACFTILFLSFALKKRPPARHRLTRPPALLAVLLGVSLAFAGIAGFSGNGDDKTPVGKRMNVPGPRPGAWKIFFLAIDGATWDCLDPLIEKGDLPTFNRLMRSGSAAKLKTLIPTFSPIIWTSIATGKKPIRHGIFNFGLYRLKGLDTQICLLPKYLGFGLLTEQAKKKDLLEFIPVTSNMRQCRAIWNILSAAGYRVGVVNWLVTMPAESVNGFMVSEIDYLSFLREPVFKVCYPEDLLASAAGLGEDPGPDFEAEYNRLFRGRAPSEQRKNIRLFKNFFRQDCIKIQTGLHLFETYQPDFFTLYLHGLDGAQHFFWKEKDMPGTGTDPSGSVVPGYYRFLDRTLDSFLKNLDSRTVVIVCSDHGFRTPGWFEKTFVIRNKELTGVHEFAPDAMLIISGSPMKKNKWMRAATIYDITPTLLALMGLPPARDMDGKVLREWFTPEAARQLIGEPVPTYDAGWQSQSEPLPLPMDREREEALKSLGYIF